MNTKKRTEICNLMVETIRKDIKNIHLAVYPPNGRIRIAAPLETSDESIHLLVVSKIPWIKRQQSKFANQERQSQRQYVSGESHYFFGKRYLLEIINSESAHKIEIKRKNRISLYTKSESTWKHRERLLECWYRSEMRKQITPLLEKWSRIMGVKVNNLSIQKMKTRWGICDPQNKKIKLNLELVKKPINCLEYVLVHEMVHLLEKKHSEEFKAKMDSFMPNWKHFKDELNQAPLSYIHWSY